MSLRLIDRKTLPQNGFIYYDPTTKQPFLEMFSFNMQANEIARFRQANNIARSSAQEAAEDLDAYTCALHPELCYDASVRNNQPYFPRASKGCGGCGGSPI